MKNTNDYFYSEKVQPKSFYKIPKILFHDPKYENLSTEAKYLYGVYMDSPDLSLQVLADLLLWSPYDILKYTAELESFNLLSYDKITRKISLQQEL